MYPWQVFKLSVFPPRPSFSSGSLQSQIPRTHSPVSRLQLHTAKEIASVSPSTIIGNYTARACRDAIHLKVNIMFMTRRRPRRVKALSSEPRRSSLLALARQVITLVKFGNSLTPAWMQAASSVLRCLSSFTHGTHWSRTQVRARMSGCSVFSTTSDWTVEQTQHPRPLISSSSRILKRKNVFTCSLI